MKLTPLPRYKTPRYPTVEILRENPAFLHALPERWRGNRLALGTLAGALMMIAPDIYAQQAKSSIWAPPDNRVGLSDAGFSIPMMMGNPAPPKRFLTEAEARKIIENIVFVPEVGALYFGKCVQYLLSKKDNSQMGAFIELVPGKDGLCHIKDLEFKRTEKVEDVLKIGQKTWVKVTEIDDRGRINLSRKEAIKEREHKGLPIDSE